MFSMRHALQFGSAHPWKFSSAMLRWYERMFDRATYKVVDSYLPNVVAAYARACDPASAGFPTGGSLSTVG